MNCITTKSKVYHGQADIDPYAKIEDFFDGMVTTSIKQIMDSYHEMIDDLMLESQEAY